MHFREQRRECYITELFVSPKDRGLGLSKLLLAAALDSTELSRAYLFVPRLNDAARKLYKRFGFQSAPVRLNATAETERMELTNIRETELRRALQKPQKKTAGGAARSRECL